METVEVDVLIIGAGISGLTAAKIIREKTLLRVGVVEANDRIGGRTLTIKDDETGDVFDLGGQWVGNSQKDIMSLIREFNWEHKLVPQYLDGRKIMQVGKGNHIRTYTSQIPNIGSFLGLIELQYWTWKMESMVGEVDPENPYKHPKAEEWDNISLHDYFTKRCWYSAVGDSIEAAVRTVFGANTSEISLLFFLTFSAAANGFLKICLADPDCAQGFKLKGGSMQISQKLLEIVGERSLYLNQPVNQIQIIDNCVHVKTTSDYLFLAKKVISAIPLNRLHQIEFEPMLSKAKFQLMTDMPLKLLVKFIVIYDRPYWRESGYSGEIVSSTPHGPINITYDATTEEGGTPALVGFVGGSNAYEHFNDDKISPEAVHRNYKSSVLKALSQFFKQEWPLKPVKFLVKDWRDEKFVQGAPVAVPKIGSMYCYHALRKVEHGRIHFAGTETATKWTGYMSGAIQAGKRAANEVIDDMKSLTQI